MLQTDLDRFRAACVYPGQFDEEAVERELAAFLRALGVSRRIVRLRAGWRPAYDQLFGRCLRWILAECVERNVAKPNLIARTFYATLAAWRHSGTLGNEAFVDFNSSEATLAVRRNSDADIAATAIALIDGGSIARAAYPDTINRRYPIWELSGFLCELLIPALPPKRGRSWRGKRAAGAWPRPLFEAFVCGCWLLYWTDDTLYWVAKPIVHREPDTRRGHRDRRAALKSDIVNLYFSLDPHVFPTDLGRFQAACAYPGVLDEQAVECELAAFLRALGAHLRIVRVQAGWRPENDPAVYPDIKWILAECAKRNVAKPGFAAGAFHATLNRDFVSFDIRFPPRVGIFPPHVRAALAAHHASDAAVAATAVAVLDHTGLTARATTATADPWSNFGVQLGVASHGLGINWRGAMWELSLVVCELFIRGFGRGIHARDGWRRPLFEAFVCGCWVLYWTRDTLYWVAKPTVHREPGTQRVHHETRAALESDIVNLYFWHGVMVPPFVVQRPDLITIAHIDRETNAEARRAMIERYRHGEDIHGAAAFIRDAGGERLDHDERCGTLWLRRIPGDEPIMIIEVVNRTREPDGHFKHYWLRVPPTMRTAREAVAWTFNMPAGRYAPEKET